MTLTIRGPRGEVSSDTHTLDRNQAQLFRAGGKRTPPPRGWPAGDYKGTVELRGGGDLLDVKSAYITLN
jgi:hypothetical protein